MSRRSVLLLSLVFACVMVPTAAHAQFNQYWLPVEQGFLDSHVDLQFEYNNLDFLGADVNIVRLSIEGQYAIADRFEVGLNVPFLMHGWVAAGTRSADDTEFGDIILNMKGRLFGLGDTFALSIYANAQLPTHSGDSDRDYAVLFSGAAASAKLLGILVGGSFDTVWAITDKTDAVFIGFSGYGAYTILGLLTFQLALQYHNSVEPSSDANAFAITPGVQVDLLDIIRVGAATRIAVTDDAKLLYMGRASFLFYGGISF